MSRYCCTPTKTSTKEPHRLNFLVFFLIHESIFLEDNCFSPPFSPLFFCFGRRRLVQKQSQSEPLECLYKDSSWEHNQQQADSYRTSQELPNQSTQTIGREKLLKTAQKHFVWAELHNRRRSKRAVPSRLLGNLINAWILQIIFTSASLLGHWGQEQHVVTLTLQRHRQIHSVGTKCE